RQLSDPGIDPYQPQLSKLRVNHIIGHSARETYGLFPLPVASVDDQFITQNKFNSYGIFASAKVFDHGNNDADFDRPLRAKLLQPLEGRARFVLSSTIPPT